MNKQSINRIWLALSVCSLFVVLLWGTLTPLAAQGPDSQNDATSIQERLQQQGLSAVEKQSPWLGGGMSDVACQNGMAGKFPCKDVDLLSWIPLPELGATNNPNTTNGSDLWGWTDPQTNKEYVIMGQSDGATFVDITNPTSPTVMGKLQAHTALNFAHLWGDMKVYSNTLYKVHESHGEGMQVFDLTRLRDATPGTTFTPTAHYAGFGNAHNIVINEQSGFAYVVGTDTDSMDTMCPAYEGKIGGLHIIDLSSPHNPTHAGCFNQDGYTHDAQCVMYGGPDADYEGAEICFNANEDTLTIADVSHKMTTTLVATATYQTAKYSHQGWLTEDHRYFLMNDEVDEFENSVTGTTTYVWDVMDLDNPTLTGMYQSGNTSIDHNLYIVDNMVYQANYASGLRIFQMNDLANADLSEVAYFDTYPEDDNPDFNGVWSVYPFFNSGVLAVSDFSRGLFILRANTTTDPTAVSISQMGSASNDAGTGLALALFGGVSALLIGGHMIRRRRRQ